MKKTNKQTKNMMIKKIKKQDTKATMELFSDIALP